MMSKMKHYDLIHNSTEWYDARAGVATSSSFDKIITNKTWKLSGQADGYANELVAEIITGKPVERNFSTYALEWGRAYEADAINLYQFEKNVDVTRGGFFVNDAHTLGASPDVRVIDKGGETLGLAEIKCPENPAVHVEFLLLQEMNPKYKAQTQGQLFVSGAPYVDWFSYHPDFDGESKFACIRIERDEKFIAALHECLAEFEDLMQKKLARCVELGIFDEVPKKQIVLPEVEDSFEYMRAG